MNKTKLSQKIIIINIIMEITAKIILTRPEIIQLNKLFLDSNKSFIVEDTFE
jgi:hypothetical protein